MCENLQAACYVVSAFEFTFLNLNFFYSFCSLLFLHCNSVKSCPLWRGCFREVFMLFLCPFFIKCHFHQDTLVLFPLENSWSRECQPALWPDQRIFKPCLPSVVMGNVQSLSDAEPHGILGVQSDVFYWDMAAQGHFGPEHLCGWFPHTIWAAWDCTENGKWKGGGLADLVNSRWCNPGHITIEEQLCSPGVVPLAFGLRPYHLPREIPHVIIIVLYIPPSANPTSACSTIHTTISKLQTKHPSALIIISGNFNYVTMETVLPTFKQYMSCPTREERALDLCMLALRMHTPPLLSPLWAGQITTWFTSNPAMCLWWRGSLQPKGLWRGGWRRLMEHCRATLK